MSRLRGVAAVVAAAIGAHLTALGGGFVWLDHAHLQDGYAIARPGHMLELFTRGFAGTGFYRPLMGLSLSLDALVGGPFVFHATSLAWHAAAAVATVAASEALGLRRRAALLAGLVFAVHPLTGLVADAIAFRSEAMVATFLLAFVWAHVRGRATLAAVLLLAGCLTKEIAFGLAPLFVVALELGASGAARAPAEESAPPSTSRRTARAQARAAKRASKRPPDVAPGAAGPAVVRSLRRLIAAECLALGAAAVLRLAYAPAFRAAHEGLGTADAIGTRLSALAKSAAAVIFPVDRTICDAFRIVHLWQPTALAGALVTLALGALAWRRRGPALLLVIALLPSLHLVPVMRWWSPHYVYVPLAFVAMLVAEAADRRGERTRTAAAVATLLLSIVTFVDGRRYASDVTLWTPEVAAQPACREGQFYLGEVDREARRWDAAARRYEAALALESGDAAEAEKLLAPETARPDALPASLVVRAMALRQLGREDEAAQLLTRAGAR
jgi:hypothetical protein